MSFVDGLFSIFGGCPRPAAAFSVQGPSANAAFPFLYELFTMTMSLQARRPRAKDVKKDVKECLRRPQGDLGR